MTRRIPAAIVASTFGAAVVVLLGAGRGELAAPPLSVDGFLRWADARDPVTACVALARVVAIVVAGWLVVVTAVSLIASFLGAARVAAATERALPAPVRRVLTGMAGAGMVSVVALGGTSDDRDQEAPPVAAEPLVLLPADGEGTATMSVLPDQTEVVASPTPPADEWTVAAGESFWSIATSVVADALGRTPTDAEVDPYWRALVAANLDRLATPNPDLVHPGQVFVLPPFRA